MELEPEAESSPPSVFWSNTSAAHWQNLMGRQVTKEPGKYNTSSTEQNREGQVWN
jgi:hypothetical protein